MLSFPLKLAALVLMALPDNPGSQLLGAPPSQVRSQHSFLPPTMDGECLLGPLPGPLSTSHHTSFKSQPHCSREFFPPCTEDSGLIAAQMSCSAPSSSPAGGSCGGGPRVPQKVPADLSVTPSHVPLLPLPLAHLTARSQRAGCWQSSRTCLDEPSQERPYSIKRE